MNANRKADLQRKLTLAPVPKPPAGLAERIKTEIPKELRFNAERERERLTRSVRFSMAVAASIIVVISAAYLSLLMTRMDQSGDKRKPAAGVAAGASPAAEPARAPAPTQIPATPPPPAKMPVAEAKPKPAKIATRRVKQEKKQAVAPAESPQVEAMAKVTAAAPAAAMDRAEAVASEEMTTSPISGKVMVHAGKDVYDAPSKTNLKPIPWKDASPETKIAILKTELARGGDREAIARAAREAGLNDFADSIEKPH